MYGRSAKGKRWKRRQTCSPMFPFAWHFRLALKELVARIGKGATEKLLADGNVARNYVSAAGTADIPPTRFSPPRLLTFAATRWPAGISPTPPANPPLYTRGIFHRSVRYQFIFRVSHANNFEQSSTTKDSTTIQRRIGNPESRKAGQRGAIVQEGKVPYEWD